MLRRAVQHFFHICFKLHFDEVIVNVGFDFSFHIFLS